MGHFRRCKWRYLIGAFLAGVLGALFFMPLWMWGQPGNMLAHRDDSASMSQDASTMSQAGIDQSGTIAQKVVPTASADGVSKTVIDVGYSQGYFDWDSAAGQIDGAILECGYGNNDSAQDDWTFAYNVQQCERLGIPYGIYLYSYASNDDMANSEADHLLRQASTCNPTLGVVIDVEQGGLEWYYQSAASIICQRVQDAGYHAIWYSGAYNASSTGLASLPFDGWVADYNAPLDYSGSVIGWQYADDGVCGVDTSYWYDSTTAVVDRPQPAPQPAPSYSSDVRYQVATQSRGVLSEMVGQTDAGGSSDWFAGVQGDPIIYIAMQMDGWYQVGTEDKPGGLPAVSAYNINDTANGCAGDGSPIIWVRCSYDTPDPASTGWMSVYYAVSPLYSDFLSTMKDTTDTGGSSDDFAGNFKPIDRFTAYLSAA
jgi:GH25 family lysozyme M1 (1,4-beta-N-acetylmuramidase)